MKTIIAGSRTITRHGLVRAAIVASGWADTITEVVSGSARGVDELGEMWAREKGVQVCRFPADWRQHGRSAGLRRNVEMADYADALIAVWDGQSRGTKHMINAARERGLHVYVYTTEEAMKTITPARQRLINLTPAPATPMTARIHCRVCDLLCEQSIHTPALLCPACLLDLDATAAHVAYVREATLQRLSEAQDRWGAILGSLDEATRARWEAVVAARETMESAAFAAKWKRTLAQGGAFASVLAAYDDNAEVADAGARQLAWCAAADAECAAARGTAPKADIGSVAGE